MKITIHLLVLFAITMALGAAAVSNAAASTQDKPYRMSDREMKSLISRIESDADRFRSSVHKEMDHAKWEDKRDREDMNRAASGFERATDRLKGHFHDGNARAEDIQEVLDRGADIDSLIMSRHLLSRTRGDWLALRRDLDQLSAAYNITWQWKNSEEEPAR